MAAAHVCECHCIDVCARHWHHTWWCAAAHMMGITTRSSPHALCGAPWRRRLKGACQCPHDAHHRASKSAHISVVPSCNPHSAAPHTEIAMHGDAMGVCHGTSSGCHTAKYTRAGPRTVLPCRLALPAARGALSLHLARIELATFSVWVCRHSHSTTGAHEAPKK